MTSSRNWIGIRTWTSHGSRAVRAVVLLLALPVLSTSTGCASMGGAGGGEAARGVGEPMPDISMDEFWQRKEIRISKLRGKVVLLDIWASWCAPCKEEMPALNEMAGRLRGKGIEVVAVSIDEDRIAAERFLRTRPRWSLTLAYDPDGAVPNRLQPSKMPTSYVIDRAGILRRVNAGFEPGDLHGLEKQLLELAAK